MLGEVNKLFGYLVQDQNFLPMNFILPSKQPRDTIVRFENGLDRDIVWKERFKLKKSQFFLSEDFSPATQEKRRQLLPYLRAARKSPEVTRTHLARDMLFINGIKYTVHSLESLPYGIKNVNMAERYFTEGGVAFHHVMENTAF